MKSSSTLAHVKVRRLSRASVLSLALAVAFAGSARAATLTVTNDVDGGAGSLRAVVATAASGDTLNFAGSLSGKTNVLTGGQIAFSNNITIDASALPSATFISASSASRIFQIASNASVTLKSLVLINGNVSADSGGAIRSAGDLTAFNCAFTNCTAQGGAGVSSPAGNNGGPGGGGAGMGGAIFMEGGSLTLSSCSFNGNRALGGNGGAGDNNGFVSDPGRNGGGPHAGVGGATSNPGGAGGFGGGGGGGSGSNGTGFDGGMGGFGGGGGGGGARGSGGAGGLGGAAGAFGGGGGAALFSHSGGGGGGAGFGGAIFASSGAVTISNCAFSFNAATNGLGGVGSFGSGNGTNGQAVGGAVFNLGAVLIATGNSFNGNTAPNGFADVFDLTVTTAADTGAGSLRSLIANAPSGGTIRFAPALSGQTITLTSGELLVSNSVTIDASALNNRVVVSGSTNSRVFNITSNTTVTFNVLVITNGHTTNAVGNGVSAAGGGGVYNAGSLSLNHCLIVGNLTGNGSSSANQSGGRGGDGGGIFNSGTLTLSNSAVMANSTGRGDITTSGVPGNSPGDSGSGGGIFNSGTLTLVNSTVANNQTEAGANATNNYPGNGGHGGGIYSSGTLTLKGCTIYGNRTGKGGDNLNHNVYGGAGGSGGGFYSTGIIATLLNSTVCSNSVAVGGTGDGPGTPGRGGGVFSVNGHTVVIENSVIANNGAAVGGASDLDAFPITRSGVNLIGANTFSAAAFPAGSPNANGDYAGTSGSPLSSRLAPLADYGGPTPTAPPLPGSLVIDHATVTTNMPVTDQRGAARIRGVAAEIGATELFAFDTVPLADTDSDGIPDVLEPAYGLVVGVNNRATDSDGDGATDAQELRAMTDPLNAASLFKITSFLRTGTGFSGPQFNVSFTTVPGFAYSLVRDTNANLSAPQFLPLGVITNTSKTVNVELPGDHNVLAVRRD